MRYHDYHALYYPIVIGFVALFTCNKGIVSKIVANRFFVFIGGISMSVYMIHAFILNYADMLPDVGNGYKIGMLYVIVVLSAWFLEKYIEIDGFLPEFSDEATFVYYFIRRMVCTGIGFWMFRRDALVKIGGYVDMPFAWWSDDMTAIMLSKNGVAMSDRVLYYFRQTGNSISGSQNNSFRLRGKLIASQMFYDRLKEITNRLSLKESDESSKNYPYSWILHELYWGHIKKLLKDTSFNGIVTSLSDIFSIRNIGKISLANAVFQALLFRR